MIDYRTRMVDCDLLPRSTRKCEIESFDRSKNYYHVDSPRLVCLDVRSK